MLTLQSTFTYDCPNPPPVDDVEIFVRYPQFSIAAAQRPDGDTTGGDGPTGNTPAPFLLSAHNILAFEQQLSKNAYSVQLPTSRIFGDDYGISMLQHIQYTMGAENIRIPKLTDFSLSFAASYGDEDAQDQARKLDAIWFLKAITAPAPRITMSATVVQPSESSFATDLGAVPAATPPAPESLTERRDIEDIEPLSMPHFGFVAAPTTPRARITDIVDSNIYIINKATYLETLNEIYESTSEDDESMLLFVINALIDLTGPSPTYSSQSEQKLRRAVDNVLRSFRRSPNDGVDVYAHVIRKFSSLFDFPLRMPCIKLLTVGGAFRIKRPSGQMQALTSNDFVLYHLSSEFAVAQGSKDLPAKFVRRYNWDRAKLADEVMTFSFAEKQVVRNRVRGPVVVRLKGFDGTDLWLGEFAASDPILQSLDIAVNLYLPDFLNDPIGDGSGAGNKKLRGKVVAMEKYCGGLKGTVVVQAKKAADSPWRTVSAGGSDKAGNFTLPYPAGTYVAAQALTSLDRNSTTSIATDPNSANKSISTDFLFILLNSDG